MSLNPTLLRFPFSCLDLLTMLTVRMFEMLNAPYLQSFRVEKRIPFVTFVSIYVYFITLYPLDIWLLIVITQIDSDIFA